MPILKRTKNGQTHYAHVISPDGSVGLTPEKTAAVEVTPDQIAKAKAYYATRPAWGVLEVDSSAPPKAAPPQPTTADYARQEKELGLAIAKRQAAEEAHAAIAKELADAHAAAKLGVAELDKVRHERGVLLGERDELRRQLEELTAPPKAKPDAPKGDAGKGGK
jgi:hypothetical protein